MGSAPSGAPATASAPAAPSAPRGAPVDAGDGGPTWLELLCAGVGFGLALIAFLLVVPGAVYPPALLMFALLAAGYFGVSIRAARKAAAAALPGGLAGAALGPLLLVAAACAYAAAAGLPVLTRAIAYTGYLLVPTLLLVLGTRTRWLPELGLLAAVTLGATIKFHLLQALPLPPPRGLDGIRLVALVAAFWLFLVRPGLDGIGYTFALRRRDLLTALRAYGVYALAALPLGLALGFLRWHPRPGALQLLLAPVTIYVETAIPEEFLFRGLIQNLLVRRIGERAGWVVASLVFGLAHLPDPRYAFLAFLAGLAYGWTYRRTGRITASALTHAAVDWTWVVLLHG